jgi:hypothetical protein
MALDKVTVEKDEGNHQSSQLGRGRRHDDRGGGPRRVPYTAEGLRNGFAALRLHAI